MVDNDGHNLQQFQNELDGNKYKDETLHNSIGGATLDRERSRVVQSVMDCITARLASIHEDPLYLACHIFDHKNWPDRNNRDALLQYGSGDIQVLYDHFSVLLQNTGCDIDIAKSEWKDLKLYVARNQHFQGTHPLAVWQRVSQEDAGRDDYGNILKIVHLTSIYPLSNAACERGFSVMKRVKNDWRCSLNNEVLDQLLRISLTGQQLDAFDPTPAVRRWWISGQRDKRPTTLPYGPRH